MRNHFYKIRNKNDIYVKHERMGNHLVGEEYVENVACVWQRRDMVC